MFKKLVSSLWNTKASVIKKKLNYFQPRILNLEDRLTPSQTVSLSLNAGVLEIKSNTSNGETNNFTVTQDSPTSNFIRFTGAGGTVFNGNAALFSSGFNTSLAEVNSLNLTAFNKILVYGGQGNDLITLGNLNGNVIGALTEANFGFEIDVLSTAGGSSLGADSLIISGSVVMKNAGVFTTDVSNNVQVAANLDSITISNSGAINSLGSGLVRLVADGTNLSNVNINNGGQINIGSGSVYLRAGANGSNRLNGNAITTIGGPVLFDSIVTLESSTLISTGLGSGGVNFNFAVQGVSASSENLTIQTSGAISFSGNVGTTTLPLGAITIGSQQAASVSIGNVIAKSLTAFVQGPFNGSGTINLNYVDGLKISTFSSIGTVNLGNAATSSPAVITSNLGSVTINNSAALNINEDLILSGSFAQAGLGSTTIGVIGAVGDLTVSTNSFPISFAAPVSLNQSVVMSSNSLGILGLGNNITFSSTLDGLFDVQLTAGAGNILFNGAIGSITPVGPILINNANKVTSNSTINANSFTVTQATNAVTFMAAQTYSQFAGLSIVTSTSNGNVVLNGSVTGTNNAQININNSGLLVIGSGANLVTDQGTITLGGSGGGSILLSSNLTSGIGAITVSNPLELQNNIVVTSNTTNNVSFLSTINSNNSGPKNIILNGNSNANFLFQSSVGATLPVGNITINSASSVIFNSTLNAGAFTVTDAINTISFLNNIILNGALTTSATTNPYNISITGLNNQILGLAALGHTGLTTFGNLNSATTLVSGGISETGGGGFIAQGSIVSGAGVNLLSSFIVGGNNVGLVSLDFAQDSVFSGVVDVQANERITKTGAGGLRLVTNTGSAFQGSFVINLGTVTVVDDFSSILSTTISGGSVAGTGVLSQIFGLSGSILPGDNVGTLNVGTTSLNSLMTFGLQIGTVSGVNDQLNVNGLISLNNALLSVTAGQYLAVGNVFTIINNDATDAVSGTFVGLPQNSTFTVGNYTFRISYTGGTGNDVTLTVTSVVSPPVVVVPGKKFTFATAADAGGGPMVTVNYADGHTNSFFAYAPSFTGGVRVAMGDINGDGFSDLVTATGIGGGPHIKVFDLRSGAPIQVASFFAFESNFTGGLYIACGNLNGDVNPTTGLVYDDIIVGAGPGGGPRITAFAGAQAFAINQSTVIVNFFAYAPEFTGGVTVASADRTGDGLDEIVTGAGYGGGPNVTVFQLQQTVPGQFNQVVIQNFFAFDTSFTGGIYVAGGRFTNSTYDDIFVGTGPGTKATVAVAFGAPSGGIHYLNPFGNFTGGVRVGIASSTLAGTTPNYLMAAAGPGGGPLVNLYNTSFAEVDSFFVLNPNVTL
ncbi:MAG: hypothetical protein EBQ87_01560, partial [Planctomycetes bacterium]|nr:hypothetical protein [Planctomycetota bacterium]